MEDECCFNRQLLSQKQWRPNNFQFGSSQVHVLNPHVQRHPCAGFPGSTFQSKTPSSQDPCCRASCSVVHEGRVAGHTGSYGQREEPATQRRRNKRTRKSCGSNLEWRLTKQIFQFLSSSMLPSMFLRTRLGIFQVILPRLLPLSAIGQGGASKPTSRRPSLLATAACKCWPLDGISQSCCDLLLNGRVPGLDGVKAISSAETVFGHPYVTIFGQSIFGQSIFGQN